MALDARTRVRQRIKRLLDERGRSQRALARWLGHTDGWVSSLVAGRFALSLDEFDRTAEFLNVPPSELVRLADDAWELSPTEMQVVRSLRMLPPVVRDHLVTLTDYLVGATPEEVGLLQRVRKLTQEDVQRLEHWIGFTLLTSGTNPGQAGPPDLKVTTSEQIVRRKRFVKR